MKHKLLQRKTKIWEVWKIN